MLKKKIAVYIVTCFILLCTFLMPAKAEEIIDNEEAFLIWLKEHRFSGGILELENDLYLTGKIDWSGGRPDLLKDITIRTNGYHIYVSGTLDMSCCNDRLHIEGIGGEEGILQVQEGGYLALGDMSICAEDNGYALVQQEGGILVTDSLELQNGRIQYAKKPVVTLSDRYKPKAFLYQAAAYIDSSAYPAECSGFANYQGEIAYNVKAKMNWAAPSTLSENKWHSITGNPNGYLQTAVSSQFQTIKAEDCFWVRMPEVRVMIMQSGVAISNSALYLNNSHQKSVSLSLMYTSEPDRVQVLRKTDTNAAWEDVSFTQYDLHDLAVEEGIEDGVYLCIEAFYKDSPAYSNVIQLQGNTIVEREDIEGNRGGGIPLQPPGQDEEPKQEEGDSDTVLLPPAHDDSEKPSPVKPPAVLLPERTQQEATGIQPLGQEETINDAVKEEPAEEAILPVQTHFNNTEKKVKAALNQNNFFRMQKHNHSTQTDTVNLNREEKTGKPPEQKKQYKETQTKKQSEVKHAWPVTDIKEKQQLDLVIGSILSMVALAGITGICYLIKKRKGVRF